jgi:hypothetical protein
MDKIRAEEIAQAILEPDIHAQEEIRRKRAAEEVRDAQARVRALFVLIGGGIGALISLFTNMRLGQGALWGLFSGAVVGWLFVWLRNRSHAA